MSHIKELEAMFRSGPYVLISEMREWCDYRRRISDLRQKRGMNIVSCMVDSPWRTGKKLRAYKLVEADGAAEK